MGLHGLGLRTLPQRCLSAQDLGRPEWVWTALSENGIKEFITAAFGDRGVRDEIYRSRL